MKQEPQVHEVPADSKAQEENRAGKVHLDSRATRDHQEQTALLELKDHQASQVCKALLD